MVLKSKKTPWIDNVMRGYTDQNTIDNTSLADKGKFVGALQDGRAYGASLTQDDLKADLVHPNKDPRGKHDSRSMAMILSDPDRKKKFENGTIADKERTLFEADFYLRGIDAYAHAHQPAQILPGNQGA